MTVKRLAVLLIVLVLATLPVVPMQRVRCPWMPASAPMPSCCQSTTVLVPVGRVMNRVPGAAIAAPRTAAISTIGFECSITYAPTPRGHYCTALATIQLRI